MKLFSTLLVTVFCTTSALAVKDAVVPLQPGVIYHVPLPKDSSAVAFAIGFKECGNKPCVPFQQDMGTILTAGLYSVVSNEAIIVIPSDAKKGPARIGAAILVQGGDNYLHYDEIILDIGGPDDSKADRSLEIS